jgi:PilZ domain
MAKRNKAAGVACPYCGGTRVQRLRRRFVDRFIMGLLWVRPFHCIECYRRFYSRSKLSPAQQEKSRAAAPRAASASDSPKSEIQIPAESGWPERRGFSRLQCEIPTHADFDGSQRITGIVIDISLTGCFLRSLTLVPAGSEIELFLDTREEAHSRGTVRRVVPGKGMGVEFIRTSALNFRRLQSVAAGSVRVHPA